MIKIPTNNEWQRRGMEAYKRGSASCTPRNARRQRALLRGGFMLLRLACAVAQPSALPQLTPPIDEPPG